MARIQFLSLIAHPSRFEGSNRNGRFILRGSYFGARLSANLKTSYFGQSSTQVLKEASPQAIVVNHVARISARTLYLAIALQSPAYLITDYLKLKITDHQYDEKAAGIAS